MNKQFPSIATAETHSVVLRVAARRARKKNKIIKMVKRKAPIFPSHYQAISNLPHFDGNPRMLRQFTTSLRHLSNSYGPEHER